MHRSADPRTRRGRAPLPRRSRPSFAALAAPVVLSPLLVACATAGGGGAPSSPSVGGAAAAATPGVTTDAPWPLKTREHVDLWLHGFAMISEDTTRVPFFRRGYRDQMVVLHNRANVTTSLDVNRDQLRSRLAINRGL